MRGPSITKEAFDLLAEHVRKNSGDWFGAHRAKMRDRVQGPFGEILEEAGKRTKDLAIPLSGGPSTIHQINRDLRFSADKRPYRDHVSGLLTPTGTKDIRDGIVFVMLHPEGGRLAGGFYNLSTQDLGRIRRRIVEQPAKFTQVVANLRKSGLTLSDESTLRTMPRGFADQARHDHADAIRLKIYLARTDLPTHCWLDGSVVDRIVDHAEKCQQLLSLGARWSDGTEQT